MTNKYREYERLKAEIERTSKSPEEYYARIRALAKKLKI